MKLYNGTINLELDHSATKHLYMVSKLLPNNVWTQPVPKEGVNKFLGVIPKFLTQWSANVASEHWLNGLRAGLTKEQWAECYDEARYKHRDLSDAGKSRGTSLHDVVERWLKKEPYEISDPDVQRQFDIFKQWWSDNKWQALEVELPCYSVLLDYCGKTDILAKTPTGKIVLCDVKSTKSGIYLDNFYQLGGYALALLEEGSVPQIDDMVIFNPNVQKDRQMSPMYASHFNMSVEDAIRSFSYCKTLTDDLETWQLRFKENK